MLDNNEINKINKFIIDIFKNYSPHMHIRACEGQIRNLGYTINNIILAYNKIYGKALQSVDTNEYFIYYLKMSNYSNLKPNTYKKIKTEQEFRASLKDPNIRIIY